MNFVNVVLKFDKLFENHLKTSSETYESVGTSRATLSKTTRACSGTSGGQGHSGTSTWQRCGGRGWGHSGELGNLKVTSNYGH